MYCGFSFNWKHRKRNDKTTFEDELKRSVILNMNEQIDDQPVSTTADGYKTHIELLTKRLKSNCCQTLYTACMIGQWIKTNLSRKKATVDMSNETFV